MESTSPGEPSLFGPGSWCQLQDVDVEEGLAAQLSAAEEPEHESKSKLNGIQHEKEPGTTSGGTTSGSNALRKWLSMVLRHRQASTRCTSIDTGPSFKARFSPHVQCLRRGLGQLPGTRWTNRCLASLHVCRTCQLPCIGRTCYASTEFA